MRVSLTVNGSPRAAEARDGESLLTFLREELALPGSKNACDQGECGSCSILLDDAHRRDPDACDLARVVERPGGEPVRGPGLADRLVGEFDQAIELTGLTPFAG